MTTTTHTTLGDLISMIYEEMLDLYGDPELASVAAATVINDILASEQQDRPEAERIAA